MKNRKIFALLLVLLVLQVCAAVPSAANVVDLPTVADASFEEWGTTGMVGAWEHGGRTGMCTASPSTEKAYTGNYSLKMTDGADNTTNHRSYITQNVGKIPTGSGIVLSARVYVEKMTTYTNGIRLIGRYGSVDGASAFNTSWITAETNGFIKLTCSTISTSADDLYITVDINQASGYVVYVDDFKLEQAKPEVKNGDFEAGTDDWGTANVSASQTENIIYKDEVKNSNVLHLTHQGYVNQRVNNLDGASVYKLRFEAKTDSATAHVKVQDSSGSQLYYLTLGKNENWTSYSIQWAMNGKTGIEILLRLVGAESNVYYDNVTLEKVENFIQNGSFEDGTNGLQHWTQDSGTATSTVSVSADAFKGKQALCIDSESDDARFKASAVSFENGRTNTEFYEYSAMVKVIEKDASSGIILTLQSDTDASSSHGFFGNETTNEMRLPIGEWVKVSQIFPIESTESSCNLWIRSRGKCKVMLDDISFRKLESPIVTFAKENGGHTDKLTNGVKATVTMPVQETGMAVLAIFERDGNAISLVDVKTHAITSTEVTSGYTKFTLTASTLSDFDATNYYAKLLMLKKGVFTPMMDDILLTK